MQPLSKIYDATIHKMQEALNDLNSLYTVISASGITNINIMYNLILVIVSMNPFITQVPCFLENQVGSMSRWTSLNVFNES